MSTNQLDLFSFLPGLEVTENEILESELASQQILKAKFPTLDLREGTGLRDMVIRPNSNMLALINKALVFYFQQNSIGEVTDDTPQSYVDKLMSNWFLTRKIGIKALLNARLYFAKAKDLSIYSDTFFSTDGTLKFFPTTSLSYAASQLTLDVNSNQYYLDIDLIAEKAGIDYNVTTGSLLYFSNFDPYFLHAEINFLRESAQDVESNTEFIARAKEAISTRNNINVPSVAANLKDNFPTLNEVKTIGFGDPEMMRDEIKILVPGVTNPIWIHNGGYADVYCRTPVASSIVQLTTDSNGKVNITGAVYKFERSDITGGTLDDTMPANQSYTWTNTFKLTSTLASVVRTGSVATATLADHGMVVGKRVKISGLDQSEYNGTVIITGIPTKDTFTYTVPGTPITPATNTGTLTYFDPRNDYGFSDRQSITVDFGVGQANKTVSFVLHYYQNIDGLQSYLSNSNNRVVCADLLAKGFNITMLDVTVTAYNGPAPDAQLANTVVTKYLDTLVAGAPFVMSDLLASLYSNGITTIQTPIGITYTKYWSDLFDTTSGVIVDVLDPNDSLNIFVVNTTTTNNAVIS